MIASGWATTWAVGTVEFGTLLLVEVAGDMLAGAAAGALRGAFRGRPDCGGLLRHALCESLEDALKTQSAVLGWNPA